MNFHEHYPLTKLRPADYNPREITPEAIEMLKKSISHLGMIKPVIVNGNGVLTAGHQRVKTCKLLGMETVPAVLLKNISRHDEIRFNLYHNRIETTYSDVSIQNAASIPYGYSFVKPDMICVREHKRPVNSSAIAKLYIKYGNWGSVVIDEDGNILLNGEYAVVMAAYRSELLVYKLSNELARHLMYYLNQDYGEYSYKALDIQPYAQYNCQMNRHKTDEDSKNSSRLYEKIVIPAVNKTERIVDFGAGQEEYYRYLKQRGYTIFAYEPYHRVKGSLNKLDINAVVREIQTLKAEIERNGLFDTVILDSVLNSTTSLEFENFVLTTCNALCKPGGRIFIATRNIKHVESGERMKKQLGETRTLQFLDKDNFGAVFRNGMWTMQKFHSRESLVQVLQRYFEVVAKPDQLDSMWHTIAFSPKVLPVEQYREALNEEFNMPYPNGFRHNRHKDLVELLIKKRFEVQDARN